MTPGNLGWKRAWRKPEPNANFWPRWLHPAACFVWITISSQSRGFPSPSPHFLPHAGLSKRLCEFRSLLINELASDPYLPTSILEVMRPCHFPAALPKRLSERHKSRGSKVSWPLPECTIIAKRWYTSSCRNPTEALPKLGGWLIRRSSPLCPARAADFVQEELWPSRAAAIIVLPLSPGPPSATPYKCPLWRRSRVIFCSGWCCLRPAARALTHEPADGGDPRLLDGAATYQTFYISQTGTNDSLSAPSPFEVAAARRPSQLFLLSPSKHPPFDMLHAHYLCPI